MTSHIRLHQSLKAVDRLLQDNESALQSAPSDETICTREEGIWTTRPRAAASDGQPSCTSVRDALPREMPESCEPDEAKKSGDLEIGDEFFDPFCGEVFKKISDTQAECLSGGDAFEGEVDDFEPDDSVQPAE